MSPSYKRRPYIYCKELIAKSRHLWQVELGITSSGSLSACAYIEIALSCRRMPLKHRRSPLRGKHYVWGCIIIHCKETPLCHDCIVLHFSMFHVLILLRLYRNGDQLGVSTRPLPLGQGKSDLQYVCPQTRSVTMSEAEKLDR